MMDFNMGGRLPFFGRVGDMTPGASILLCLLLAAAVVAVVFIIRARLNDGRHMELTVKARVAEKREAKSGMECVVTFELPDGETKALRLAAVEAGTLARGDKGKLTYRGKRFVAFEKENSRHAAR